MSNMIPQYDTILMTKIWDNDDDFLDDYKDSALYQDVSKITDTSARSLF